jgi:hypothetical protein
VDPDPLNAEQQAWITQYVQEFHDVLHQDPIGDYAAYMDVPSFVDYFIVSELTRDVDSYVRSAFYHKDRDQKIKAGPLWDYNFALGGVGAMNAVPEPPETDPETDPERPGGGGFMGAEDTGWRFNGARNVNNWYPKLASDPAFMDQVIARYTELRQTLLSEAAIEERMNALTAPLARAVARDYAKWPVEEIITTDTGFLGGPTEPTWEGQVQVMRDFIMARLAWIDENLPNAINAQAE